MPRVPKSIPDKIKYFNDRQADWTTNSTAIGFAAGDMTTMAGLISTASNALTAQGNAQAAAKAATVTLHDSVQLLARFGADLIQKIDTKAAISGNSIYTLAMVDPPAPPSPTPAPGQPTGLTAELQADGSLSLKWKCTSQGGGAVYQVWRRNDPTGNFIYLGGTGEKQFTDMTIPAGSSQVTYQLQAVKPTGASPWAQFNVNFGTGSGSTTVTESQPVKIPA